VAINRRHLLAALALGGSLVRAQARPAAPRLLAAWDEPDGSHHVGVWRAGAAGLSKQVSVEVPTRAHGLIAADARTWVAVARRPGDWWMHWSPPASPRFVWAIEGRVFNGHVLRVGDRWLTTETDVESGAGVIGVWRADDLARIDEWPTQGIDAHALLLDADGTLIVANGGVPTRPETGRARRDLEGMDSSLVRLDAVKGRMLAQWRLDDPRLSLRHLARQGATIGVALQAEHDDPAQREAAPLLALLEGGMLCSVPPQRATGGYGGDIVGLDGGFCVSGTRAHALWCWRPGEAGRQVALPEAGALAVGDGRLWAAGRGEAVELGGTDRRRPLAVRFDNHWQALPG
jgi:hypothetical protein